MDTVDQPVPADRKLTRSIRSTGISTLIVDCNYRAVPAHTNSAAVLEKGRIMLQGEPCHLPAFYFAHMRLEEEQVPPTVRCRK